MAESNPTFSSVDGVLYDKNKTTALLCPRGITGSLTINACIDDYSFYRSSLDSITLTSNVKSVGSNAFAYSSISNVILPEEEIVFGNSVFYGCAKLSSINLSSSSKELPDGMFTDCPLLILTELPKNIQRIGTAAFRNCTNVNINGFPESLRYIGEMAFLNSGIENVSLGAATDVVVGRAAFNTDSLKTATLGKVSLDGVDKAQYRYVFYGKNLESITTTENFKLWSQTGPLSIGSDGELFACLPKYEGTVIVPDGVTSVLNAFHGCYGLTEIIFHDLTSTVTIGSSYHSPGSFNGCVSLSSVVLPNVILAENNTFNGCTSLERVSIKTIDRIGNFMFKGTKLSELNFDYSKTIYVGMSAFENMNIKSFDASGMEVAKYAFKGCRELTSFVTDANTVLNTGALSYTGIKSITIYLDNPVKLDLSYGMSTMSGVASRLCEGCDSLSEINFEVGNSSNLVIGERTFSGCTSLKHIVMPQSLNTIYLYDESFKASGLESFGVQCNSILAVNGCFEDCSSLKSVVLNTVLPFTVASHAFANCTSLSELRGNTGSIDMSAFVGCTALNVIKLGGKSIINSDKNNPGFNIEDYHMATVDIGGYSGSYEGLLALLEYPSIKEFSCTELNDSYSVADGAVYQLTDGTPTCLLMCSESVESVIVPNTVRTIGEHAFDRCYNLSEVVFPGTISSFEYVPHSGPSFHSADGTTIDSSLLEFLNGHRFTKKNSVEGLVANPIITFVVDGSIIDTVLYVWGEEYLEPAVPEKTGYDGFWQDYDPTLGDLRVNATYSPHMHTVQYVLDGEIYGSVENHAFSESVSLRDIPKRTGYSFSSWSADNVEIVDGKFVMGDADVVMVSASSLNHHTVTYRLDGVQMGDPETYGYGFEVTVRETPVKPGCEATPWVSNVEVSIAENKFVMGDDDVVFDSKSIKIVVAEEDGSATVELSGGETAFRASAGIKTVRVLMGEGKGVTVGDASPVIGKVVDCQLKSKINTSDVSGIAYEFVFTADGTPYGGTMQVTLPYVGEDGKGPAVYFWDGSKSTRMNIISSTDTSVTFETDHNSEYIVASEYISAESGFGGVAIILIIVVVAILCIGAMFAIRHRRTSV